MNSFKTQADVMVATAGKVDDTNAEVQGELVRLGGVVDGLRASWDGRAQRSFNNLMERYNNASQQLREALASISDNIRDNAKNFEGTEADNTTALDNVGASAGLPL